MKEVKFLGRGGQGVVIASQILARAFFYAGFYPQCYSLFGGERRGAPVKGFLRVDREKVLLKCEIKKADELILMAEDLMLEEDVLSQLKPGGLLLLNSSRPPAQAEGVRMAVIDAQAIAEDCGLKAIVNTAVLGAYSRLNPELPLSLLEKAVRESVPSKIEANVEALRRGYERVSIL
jgi:2-oxoacid:acceptor oxidoreductase gamma subunit (pyruvate/2-ketoisovalerate family)